MSLFRKIVKWIVVSGTCILPAAYGQTDIHVTVPFAFHIEEKTFSAGDYLVKASSGQSVVLLQSTDYNHAQVVMTHAAQAPTPMEKPTLMFQRYGDEYFLSTVWLPGSYTGRQLSPSRKQMELARKLSAPERAILVGKLETKKP